MITDHQSKYGNKEKSEILGKFPKHVTGRYELSKVCWKNGTDKLIQGRAATNLQSIKNTII